MAHIDAAVKHYKRGQSEPDQTLFTDVVFRCNQAFEGSVKEAYRVLAGKDPSHIKPHKIEEFLSEADLLRKKVLDQFTRYRTEWRNPSTHDYTLDFDEDEGLMAIVSVTVFAIVLCDQIDGKLAFDAAAEPKTSQSNSTIEQNEPLLDVVADTLAKFAGEQIQGDTAVHDQSTRHYFHVAGTIAGYLSSELASIPRVDVKQGQTFSERETDIVVERVSDTGVAERIVVELKISSPRGRSLPRQYIERNAVQKAAFFLHLPDVNGAVVFLYSGNKRHYRVFDAAGIPAEKLRVVAPALDTKSQRSDDAPAG
ncbi:hypothetical protein FBZ94_104642 [Bradyrhizobium sacchari]|uniref:Uncharacterized protein n=2 Tax=Bradyrhizobium sacchari TaxID=1399419 RepID=A0A560JRK8_9BRAD|nr:hypothetical protein FBZ94_104642 [Bradyrhizobium sacchari]TWB73773.1 hypothetical protein FBZ95_10523 [Bradyrhizobium sacchari]